MSEYKKVKKQALIFKGVNRSEIQRKKDARKKIKKAEEILLISTTLVEESKNHGGWWIVDRHENVPSGKVCFQHESGAYLTCLETGEISLGDPFGEEDPGPTKEETFTLVKVTDNKYGVKTFYGMDVYINIDRYISANSRGQVYSRSEAISPQESIELVIQDGKVALQSHHKYFLSYSHGVLSASSTAANSGNEIFTMRTNKSYRQCKELKETDLEDPAVCELNMVKKFQSFANQRVIVTKEPTDKLLKAREDGFLCEELLNRRTKHAYRGEADC
ncbi:hypothetical protein MXB_5043 [Myxobolus squamalis]|nr:hypothetical protein MXB_5043 [Myxobolus squamalis]